MRREDVQLLLISKIPTNRDIQKEIIQTLDLACEEKQLEDYLSLLRASYMNVVEIQPRREYYLDLGKKLQEHLRRRPQLAVGQTGLYIGFLAEDYLKTRDQDLISLGKGLNLALRLASNPQPISVSGKVLPELPSAKVSPELASRDPEGWIRVLLECAELRQCSSLKERIQELEERWKKGKGGVREVANSLVLIGAHLEEPPHTPWAKACYRVASVLDETYDLPWAFLAAMEKDLTEALTLANRAVRANPRSLMGLRTRGRVFSQLGRLDEAFRDLAEVARYGVDNPNSLLSCARAGVEAGYALLAARLYLLVGARFPVLPEPWHGLARLFWRSGLPAMALQCQEKVRNLTFGEIPRDLRLPGRLTIESAERSAAILLDHNPVGKGKVELSEVRPGEHRIQWEGGPTRRFFLEEGECLRLSWTGKSDELLINTFMPDVVSWHVSPDPDEDQEISARALLSPYLERPLAEWATEMDIAGILAEVPPPLSPFGHEGRLTVESVYRILIEEIMADGVLDHSEHEVLRAVRYRLLLDSSRVRAIMEETRRKVVSEKRTAHGTLNPGALYRRVYRKACEDGVVDPSEKILLECVAECLLLNKAQVEAIHREEEQKT